MLILLAVLLALGGLGGGFYFAAKKDKLPAKLKPWGQKLLTKLGQNKPAQTADGEKVPEAAGEAAQAQPAKPQPPQPEKPKSRPAFLRELEALQEEYRNTASEKRGKWLEKAEKTFQRLGPSVTPEEYAVLCKTWELYSAADEQLRFRTAREAARRKYEKMVTERQNARAKEALEQQKRQEAEAKRQQALARENAQLASINKKRQAEEKIRFAKLKKELDAYTDNLIRAVMSSAESGDNTAFEQALSAAKSYQIPENCDSDAEHRALQNFYDLIKFAPAAQKSYRQFVEESRSLKISRNLAIHNNMVSITGITAQGQLLYKNTWGEKGTYTPETTQERKRINRFIDKNVNMTGAVFYYNLLNRHVTAEIMKQCPNPFWKAAFTHNKKLLNK